MCGQHSLNHATWLATTGLALSSSGGVGSDLSVQLSTCRLLLHSRRTQEPSTHEPFTLASRSGRSLSQVDASIHRQPVVAQADQQADRPTLDAGEGRGPAWGRQQRPPLESPRRRARYLGRVDPR